MSLKLNKTQEGILNCICGICNHGYESKACPYNKIVDAELPGEEQKKQIIKLFEVIFEDNKKKK